MTQRPAPGVNWLVWLLLAVVLAAALACLGGGVFLLVQRETGTRVRATVTGCVESTFSRPGIYKCTGTWQISEGRSGGERVVVGPVVGAAPSEVGKTIEVTASGDRAYSRSLALPTVLIAVGLVPLLAVVSLVAAGRRARRRRAAAAVAPL